MGVISPHTGNPLNVLVAAPVASPQLLATGVRGPKGPKGDPFRVNAQGPTSELSLYANEESGFSFLAVDSGLLYLRAGETPGVWAAPVVFGGPQGIPGESGRGINGAALSAGHLVLSYSDGQEDDLGNVQGPMGPTGPTGRNITAAAIDGSGHLILSLSDASVLDVGLVIGESGSWGSITGLLSNQADLAEALNNKVTVEAGKGLSTEDYSSAEKTKLAAIAPNATANATDAELRDRSTHTGTQAASTISDFAATVRATVLTGLSLASGAAITAADSALIAWGKLQKQITDLVTSVAGKQDTLVSGTTIKTVNGSTLLGAGNLVVSGVVTQCIIIAASDETTALTAGTAKVTFRMPYGFTLTAVRASLVTAQTSGSLLTVDINEAGTSILSTKLTFDNTEKTTVTAATVPVISDANLADDAEITVDIDVIGDGTAKGLKVTLIGYKP